VLTDIETGMRWGELVALRPRHVDFLRRLISVEEAVVEVSKRSSPTGERMVFKPYPKDREFRTLRISPDLTERLAARAQDMNSAGTTSSSRRPSTAVRSPCPGTRSAPAAGAQRLPAPTSPLVCACTTFATRRSWLLAGGADLKTVMDRLGHPQIQTTQKYLHTLPDADDQALDAVTRIRSRWLHK
jgi:integrase